MKKRFPLKDVLDYRNLILDKEQDKLAQLITIRDKARINLDETNQMIKDKRQELENDIKQRIFHETDMYDKFIKLAIIQGARYEQELITSTDAVIKQQRVVQTALQNLEIIKKLDEKHNEDYRVYINKLEQKELDELNILRRSSNED